MTLDRSLVPEPGSAPLLSLPGPERSTLDNGLKLSTVRRSRLPETALSLVLPAGAASTAVDRAGLASLVARVLPEGAAGRGAREMAKWLDGIGLQLGVAVGYDSMVVQVHTLSEQITPALDAIAAVVLEPSFLDDEVERCRDQRVDSIRRARDEPAEVAADVLAELLFGDHPYGRLARGREDTVRRFRRADLVEFHHDRFSAPSATLVACGDLPANFDLLVERRLGGWGGPEVENGPPPSASRVADPGIFLVDRPGSQQSEIRIGSLGLQRGSPDEPAVRVTNAILGGLFNSRLNMNLREDKGWTYGARSTLSLRRSRGPLTMSAAVETRVTGAAVREMLHEAARMCESFPSADEMRTAAGALTRSLPLRFETNAQIAGKIVEQEVYGLPEDYWPAYSSRIEAVSGPQVREMSARLLDPISLAVLVVGDASIVAPALEELGPIRLREAP